VCEDSWNLIPYLVIISFVCGKVCSFYFILLILSLRLSLSSILSTPKLCEYPWNLIPYLITIPFECGEIR